MSLHWRGEVSHASVPLHVHCGQDSLVACRLTSSRDVCAATTLLWAHLIIVRLHVHHRRRMLETLVGVKESVVHNGYAYSSLARHDPHSYPRAYRADMCEIKKMYSVDPLGS
jgi:hypothetical protein